MRDEYRNTAVPLIEVAEMRGRAVYVARAKLGGIWWNVGVFADDAEAQNSLRTHWATPDVKDTKVDTMVVR